MFEILGVNGKYVRDEIPARKEDELEVPNFKGDASERAVRCAQMRGYRAAVAKKKRKEEIANRIVDSICEALFGVFIFTFFFGCLFLACI